MRREVNNYRIAFLLSHPIQYFSPLLIKIAKSSFMHLTVYYCSDESIRGMKDSGFGREVKWDIPLLEGYNYKFLRNYSPTPTIFKSIIGLINPGIVIELQKNRYDAIIIHGWNYITHIITFIIAFLLRIPVLLRAESPLNQELLKSKWKIFLKKILLGLLFKRISGFLAIGSENKEFYKFYGVPENKIFLTPYAVDNERFIRSYERYAQHKQEIMREIGIPEGKKVILFCGKLIDKKRPFDLLKAYELVYNDSKALVYIGDGILRNELEHYVKEHNIRDVYFLGFKNQDELPKYYAIADIFVLPSTAGETWGLVVNEAMCFSVPVVVSDMVGCARDLVKHGENGFVYPVGDTNKLSEYLSKLLGDDELRKKMGEYSFEIIQKWNYNEGVEKILTAIEYVTKY
jgi:glycosyltransferase involved in cell wall biosynthesis